MSDPLETQADSEVGISEEDKRDIRLQIEQVVAENRINTDGDIFRLSPEKRGVLFPIVVNLLGAGVLVGGIALLSWFFQAEEQELLQAGQLEFVAESLLIEEIRREAERNMAEKEAEIAAIEARLSAIENERADIAADVNRQIQEREDQLREEFERELEAERQRLLALNLSDADLAAQLAAFEAERSAELDAQINEFRLAAQAEQERLEQELAERAAEFNRSLETANQERQALEAEADARMAEMQRQLEEERAAGQEEATAAQAELREISERARREQSVRGQITGLFSGLAEAVNREDIPLARRRISDLRQLLNDPNTLRFDSLREQQPANLFLVQSLENYVELLERASVEGNREQLLQQIQDLETAVAAADDAQRQLVSEFETLQEFSQETMDALAAADEEIETLLSNIEALTSAATSREAALVAEVEAAQNELMQQQQSSSQTIAAAQQRVSQLEQELTALRELQAAVPEDAPLSEEIQRELAQLRELQQTVRTAQQDFARYRQNASNVLAARSAFSDYLGSSSVQTLLPQLQAEVARFERAWGDGGRESALVDMADVVIELSMLDTVDDRIADIRQRMQGEPSDSPQRAFLSELEILLRTP